MFQFMLIATVIGLVFYLFWKWATSNLDLYEKQGLKYQKPLPIIGNSSYVFTGKGIVHKILSCYEMFPTEKIFGIFEFRTPYYFIRSPDLVKQLTIKDSAYFQDHVPFVNTSNDEIFGNVLFLMKGKQWRDMRSSLSPIFTGSKMRTMLQLITNCTKPTVDFIHEEISKNGLKPYRMKDFFSRYSNDVIATCAFGVECDSFRQPTNEIFQIGQSLLQFQKPSVMIKFLCMRFLPSLSKLLRIKVLDSETYRIFYKLIIDTMNVRQREGIVRPDLLQLLIKLKEGQLNEAQGHEHTTEQESEEQTLGEGEIKHTWRDIELIAQSFQFFVAGFDTSSTAMTFIAYELAANPDIQSKLIAEVDQIHEHLGEEPLKYEIFQKMKYMDMVISEALRKWPPLVVLDRKCIKQYTFDDGEGLKFTIEEGNAIWIPVYAFHMDPKYFPNPEKFDPERFSDENRANIDLNAYLPFGIGPRSCIGIRFALMEIKALLYQLLLDFKFVPCKETEIPLKLKNSLFGLIPEKEIQLNIEPRRTKNS